LPEGIRGLEQDVFNGYSLPTFAAAWLSWTLAAYILTRSPRNAVSMAGVATAATAALYLLGQGLLANATVLEDWQLWSRTFQWGTVVGLVLWYWLTTLLLREQPVATLQTYLRRVGYPVGVILGIGGIALAASIYTGESLYQWSSPIRLPPEQSTYFTFRAPTGSLYPGLVVLNIGAMVGGAINALIGWRLSQDPQQRRRFAWLLGSAALFVLGTSPTAIAHLLTVEGWPIWLGHLALAAGLAILAVNVAANSFVVQEQDRVIRTDLLYFLTAIGTVSVAYLGVILLVGPAFDFSMLGLLAVTLLVVIVSHALVDVARSGLDRLFFGREVQRFRSNLTTAVQSAAMARDLDDVISQARVDIEEASAEHLTRLTELALRRLNNPSALAKSGLAARIPLTIANARDSQVGGNAPMATPLEEARAVRDVLIAAIERLKPAGDDDRASNPGALQYHILREEYLVGKPNKQIMIRYSISEGTFHRNRRQAIVILAQELSRREEILTQEKDGGA
jgi:hypothetical protein